jgi:hypothetical protein
MSRADRRPTGPREFESAIIRDICAGATAVAIVDERVTEFIGTSKDGPAELRIAQVLRSD